MTNILWGVVAVAAILLLVGWLTPAVVGDSVERLATMWNQIGGTGIAALRGALGR